MEKTEAILHIRFEGTSRDIPFSELGISTNSSDQEIKNAVQNFLDVAAAKLSGYVVEREATGNLTLRPEAVFG